MDKKKRIEVNSSSLVDLKAELFRKQEEFKREKLGKSSKEVTGKVVPKKHSIWNKKNVGINSRNQKDAEELEKERNEIEKSRSMLEAKAKLYEQMTSGNSIPDEQTNSLFLVDFEKKQLDKLNDSKKDRGDRKTAGQDFNSDEEEEDVLAPDSEIAPPSNPEEEWVDYTDTLGRSRRCMKKDLPDLMKMDKNLHPDKFREESMKTDDDETTPELMSSDMHRERMRQKWEKEEAELLDRGQTSIHYQNVRFDEVRTHGVGYFDFAKDEDTREQQMNTLKFLRDETIDKRAKREDLKAKRKAAMEARLEKVRQRKKMKMGVMEGPGLKEDGTSEKETEEAGNVKTTEEEKKVEEAVDPNWQRTLRMIDSARKESAKATREWDVGKEPKAWADQRAEMRDERLAEFAPPTDYTPTSQRKRGKIIKQSQKGGEGESVQGSRQNQPFAGHGSSGEQLFKMNESGNTKIDNKRNYDVSNDKAAERSASPEVGFDDSRDRESNESNVRTQSWSGGSVYLGQDGLGVKDKEFNRDLLQKSNIRMENSLLGKGIGLPDSKGVSESAPECGQSVSGRSESQSLSQSAPDAESKEAQTGHKPTPLIRTENSKPIKFSIGIGKQKVDKELPSSSNALERDEAEEIKRTLSLFRNQTS